jgi:hypothetical protein
MFIIEKFTNKMNKRKIDEVILSEQVISKKKKIRKIFCTDDLIPIILLFLNIKELMNFIQTSSKYYKIYLLYEKEIWKNLIYANFWINIEANKILKQIYKNLLSLSKKPIDYKPILLNKQSLLKTDDELVICESRISIVTQNIMVSGSLNLIKGGDSHENFEIPDPLLIWDISRMKVLKLIPDHALWILCSNEKFVYSSYGNNILKKTCTETWKNTTYFFSNEITSIILVKNEYLFCGLKNGQLAYCKIGDEYNIKYRDIFNLKTSILTIEYYDSFFAIGNYFYY